MKNKLITGKSSSSRLSYAMKTFYNEDHYDSVVCSRVSKINRFNAPDEDSLLILNALYDYELMLAVSMTVDGMMHERSGKDPRQVFPDVVILVSKEVLGDLINSVSLKRRFQLIDLDDESME